MSSLFFAGPPSPFAPDVLVSIRHGGMNLSDTAVIVIVVVVVGGDAAAAAACCVLSCITMAALLFRFLLR